MDPDRPAASRRPRVAVLAPMPSELRPLFALLRLERWDGCEAAPFRGSAGRVEVVATLTGVGMTAAAACAARIIDAASPDHVVVVGIAGGIGESIAVGDVVVPDRVLDLESGVTHQPCPLGDRPGRGTLASANALLESPEAAAELGERGVIAIDMETAAIAAVCEQRGCPWSVFRAISDRADDGTTDAAVLGLIDSDGSPNLAAVARFVLTRPHRIPQLVRLARGSSAAMQAAANAAAAAIERL